MWEIEGHCIVTRLNIVDKSLRFELFLTRQFENFWSKPSSEPEPF